MIVFGMDEMHAFDPKTGQAISANKGEGGT